MKIFLLLLITNFANTVDLVKEEKIARNRNQRELNIINSIYSKKNKVELKNITLKEA